MRVSKKCEVCDEEVIFDIEGVNVFNPRDLVSMDPYIEPLFDEFGKGRVLKELDGVAVMRGYKKARFFEKCHKCNFENKLVIYSQPM